VSGSNKEDRKMKTRKLLGLITSGIVASAVQPAFHARAESQETAKAPSLRLATGQYITPTALRGSTQQFLNPKLSAYPSFVAGEAVRSQLSPDGRVLPRLAQSWTWDQDGLALRVNLRPGVVFHNGEPLTASLAADLLRKAIAEPANRAVYTSFNDVRDVRPIGDSQLVFYLSQRSSFLPEDLVIPVELGKPSVGTGAYRIAKRDDEGISLEGNKRYYLGPPQIDKVQIKIFDAGGRLLSTRNVSPLLPSSTYRTVLAGFPAGGQVQVQFSSMPPAIEHIRTGKLRALDAAIALSARISIISSYSATLAPGVRARFQM